KTARKRASLAVTNVLTSLPAPVPLPSVGPGVAPDGDPGGFGIEGDLMPNFPGADRSSDWAANPSPAPSGSPVGDYILNNDGAAAQFFVYRWQASAASPIGFDYIAEPTTAGTVFIAANTGGAVAVPYAAFGGNSYPLNTFAEAAVNLNALLANFGFNPCIGIK